MKGGLTTSAGGALCFRWLVLVLWLLELEPLVMAHRWMMKSSSSPSTCSSMDRLSASRKSRGYDTKQGTRLAQLA